MKHKDQKGFSAVAAVIIVVVIAAATLAGWYVWSKNKTAAPKKSDNTATQSTNQTNQKQNDPSEGGKYLVIKEWGVRFPLPDELRGDVIYGLATLKPDNSQVVRFEVTSIAQLPGSNCKLFEDSNGSGKTGGIGVSLLRSAEQISEPEVRQFSSTVPQFDEYWYYLSPQKGSCLSNPEDQSQRDVNAADALFDALKKLEPLKS